MSKNNASGEESKMNNQIGTKNKNIDSEKMNGKKGIKQFIFHMGSQISLFFSKPVKFFEEINPRKKPTSEIMPMLISMLIPIVAAFIGMLSIIWAPLAANKFDSFFASNWRDTFFILLGALTIIGIPSLMFSFLGNFRNRKTAPGHVIMFSLRQWMVQYWPFAIGFFLLLLPRIIEPVWNIERLTVFFLLMTHLILIWQCIIFSSFIYAQSKKKTLSIIMGIGIFIAVILLEQILAIILNDWLLEGWTIVDLWREFMWWGMYT